MNDLVAFIRARLNEDEANAKRFVLATPIPPGYGGPDQAGMLFLSDLMQVRILRQVEAMRAIVDQWDAMPAGSPVLTFALHELAAIWRDHPDYRTA